MEPPQAAPPSACLCRPQEHAMHMTSLELHRDNLMSSRTLHPLLYHAAREKRALYRLDIVPTRSNPTLWYQSGCCKPPSSCAFTYRNETWWETNPGVPTVVTDFDCHTWNNDQQTLCFNCDSCKAGVLASIKKSWRKVAILNIVVLIILVIVYVAGCAAFRNARRIENDEPIGMARMTKSQPSRFQF